MSKVSNYELFRAIKEKLSTLKTISIGTNYITIGNFGMCWGSYDQSYASTGQKTTTVQFPITFSATPFPFVSTQDAMRGYGSGTPNGYGIIAGSTSADVHVWVNRAYPSGTNKVYWMVLGNV